MSNGGSGRNVVVVGATGAVGQQFVQILEQRNFPTKRVRFLASARSVGKSVTFRGKEYPVEELTEKSFDGDEIALFSAGSGTSRKFAPIAAAAKCIVIDNSSCWRMDPDVPLVVPEVNPQDIFKARKGIIANPNCSTIQMVVALKPLHDAAKIKRIVVTTMQSVSGAGHYAMEELRLQTADLLAGKPAQPKIFPHQIAFNALPQIPQSNAFEANGYTSEEMKLLNETRKIMGDPSINVTMTCVRVPVFMAHSEAVNIETERKLSAADARALLAKAPGVVVVDDVARQQYPLATVAGGTDPVYVGRIREDFSIANGLNIWVVSDNLRKGAALNAIQIAEVLIKGKSGCGCGCGH
ncbi:MAG: aspartate-semialdehyde dehydrogenase [Phycisphaerae bacterium]|nr:aspartate-semialdehyde dehydrogenase [Phycisphaerae bacterium]